MSDTKIEKLLQKIERLEKENKKLRKNKSYGLVWDVEREPEQVVVDCEKKLPVLKEIKSKKIETDKDKPMNILIEGDNYHALQVLNYTHKEEIDLICIDPPYNTGGDSFKYNDKIVDSEDSFRHSKWLSFMENRLKLAKTLLKSTGSILIFIDDNELAQLRLLMDEIFGEKNFKNCIIWAYRTGGAPRKTNIFSSKHDYILFYSKSQNLKFNLLKEKILYKKDFFGCKKDDEGNFYASVNLRDFIEGEIELLKDDKFYKKITVKPVLNLSSERVEGFPSQKPVGLIKFFLELLTEEKSIICDFFAGSGTLGEAVLELNKENNCKRTFIICTNDENKICSKICYPRIKRAIFGYKNRAALKGNLSYFKTGFVDVDGLSSISDEKRLKLTFEAGKIIALKEDIFDEKEKNEYYQIFEGKDKIVGIYFLEDHEMLDELVEKLDKSKVNNKVLYLFSWGKNEYLSEDFGDNIQVKDIPEPIIQVYKKINSI